MRELSLFTGAGGGVIGTHCLLGWQTLGYVEINDYCQRVIKQRIADGIFDDAPIFGDIRAFIDQGYAGAYTGMVDVLTAGFPCQPFSIAGKRRGSDDKRNLWPETIECIRIIRPRYAFLENVPGLLSSGYFGTILGDLAESGYGCRWRILSAAELGAPHLRRRLWIVANSTSERFAKTRECIGRSEERTTRICERVPDSLRIVSQAGRESTRWEAGTDTFRRCARTELCDTASQGLAQRKGESENQREKQPAFIRTNWWAVEPGLGRVANGLAYRVDRLTAIGNGQVPAVAATAWNLLTIDIENDQGETDD